MTTKGGLRAGDGMKQIELVIYQEEVDGELSWWATTPDVPELLAGDDTLPALRERARDALEWLLGEPVEIVKERFAEPGEDEDDGSDELGRAS
jgi:predicted RNase H-like HicB family nuclease